MRSLTMSSNAEMKATTILLETFVAAPIERVFDLARSVDFHKLSTRHTNEEAIAGKTSGLVSLNDTITWRAKHLGVYQTLTVKIVSFDPPSSFVDIMLKGAFASMKHTHRFEAVPNGTVMYDVFEFTSPLGALGHLVNALFLKNYMKQLLLKRNRELKSLAESDKWKPLLTP